MGAPGGPKTGGRRKGPANKSTASRQAQMQKVNEALIAVGDDPLTGMALLRRVLNDPDTPLDVRVTCASLLIKHEQAEAADTRYCAVMPLPVKDLDEWKARYAHAKPDASPEEAAWHLELAEKILKQETEPVSLNIPPDVKKDEPQ